MYLSILYNKARLRPARLLLFVLFILLSNVGIAAAQSSQISGQVIDAQAAALTGVNLTLSRVETGETRQSVSGGTGYFSFPLLAPGHYDLVAERDGFQSQRQAGIVVVTGNITAVNFTLQVGEVTQAISVQAGAPLLQFESSAVGKAIENETIMDMPLLDRRASQLQRLNGFEVGNGSGSGATFAIATPRTKPKLIVI
jgi:hypothetical protein